LENEAAMSEWNDEDFHTPPDRSFSELVASLAQRLSGGGQLDGALIEDLRLYIVTRKLQKLDIGQIDDELIAWGLPPEYVVELTRSTLSAGNYGEVIISTEVFVDGRSAGINRNPTYGQRVRGMERAEKRIRLAASMVAPPPSNPLLQFDTVGVPTPETIHDHEEGWKKFFHQIMYAVFAVGGLVVIVMVLYFAGLRW